MNPDTDRPLPFRVRPRHLETETSLTRRILETNGEPKTLKKRLLATVGADAGDWAAILHSKNRSTPHSHRPATPRHRDDTSCPQCTAFLPARLMCSLCSQGDPVEQIPHFSAPVCLRHNRWVGLFDTAPHQHAVDEPHRDAARTFAKLVRKKLLDVPLYRLVNAAVMDEHSLSEAAAFPPTVAIIAATTSLAFQQELLDPTLTFARAHRMLDRTVRRSVGSASPATSRALWLVMRSAFATARALSRGARIPLSSHPHDFPVHPQVLKNIPPAAEREPFFQYLAVTNDTVPTASMFLKCTHPRVDAHSGRHQLVCLHGHAYDAASASARCSACPRSAQAHPGVNDLATVAPHLAREWNKAANAPLTPHMVSARSATKVTWTCRKGHDYTATPNNRTSNGQECPVCLNRVIVAGVNDFATRYPKKFAELSPRALAQYDPQRDTPSSGKLVSWTCALGHTFKARFRERAAGHSCLQCRRLRSVAKRGSLASTHPDLAAQWVTTEDGRSPHDYSAGSAYRATWRCKADHLFTARIERRVHGSTCPYCANRLLLAGFNDFASTHPALAAEWHPYKNREHPAEVFAGSIPHRWWKCRSGHETQQSIPHRITSRGCTSCAPGERSQPLKREQAAQAPLASQETNEPNLPADGCDTKNTDVADEQAMADTLRGLFSPRGFGNDSITEAWAEVAGFQDNHYDPGSVLRAVLGGTALGLSLPVADGIVDAVLDLFEAVPGTRLPPPLQLITASRAAVQVIHDCDGPFESEDALHAAVVRRTVVTPVLTPS